MSRAVETLEDEPPSERAGSPVPGVVEILRAGIPYLRAHALVDGVIRLGRGEKGSIDLADDRVSREHAEVRRANGRWAVRDLGSRNGTFVDAQPLAEPKEFAAIRSVRVGQSIVVPVSDVRPYDGSHALDGDEAVVGPLLRRSLDAIARVGQAGDSLLVTGESGAGKEIAARTFHRASVKGSAPFVQVNCAAIPHGVAERLLFGAKRGAYSGATSDATGYLQAADGGVLFLDELGELELEVQAKLLRALETKEVVPLGASSGRFVDVRVVSATNRDLRALIRDGKFRTDLFYRIAQEHVVLPPLRARPEEIPWLVRREATRVDRSLSVPAQFIEACLQRPWPGNVRELLAETRKSARAAIAAGGRALTERHLSEDAGRAVEAEEEAESSPPEGSSAAPTKTPRAAADDPRREELAAALEAHDGNVSAVARALGMHRTQVYRLARRLQLLPKGR